VNVEFSDDLEIKGQERGNLLQETQLYRLGKG
jgi:hypothetical protein